MSPRRLHANGRRVDVCSTAMVTKSMVAKDMVDVGFAAMITKGMATKGMINTCSTVQHTCAYTMQPA